MAHYDFDAAINQLENNPIEVTKPAMPKIIGTRRSVLIYINDDKRPIEGYIVEDADPIRLIHDFQVPGSAVSHVGRLEPAGPEIFNLYSDFVHAKKNPSLKVVFAGQLTKTDDGYTGDVTVVTEGYEDDQTWNLVYDD